MAAATRTAPAKAAKTAKAAKAVKTAKAPKTTKAAKKAPAEVAVATVAIDDVLVDAVDLARAALLEITEPGMVGEHRSVDMLGDGLAMHWFECTNAGYVGWQWGVSVARAPFADVATVCETNLLPGPEAILAPAWLPWAERLAPGDVGPGDVLPYRGDDPNLEPGFEATGDEDIDQMAEWELGLGRPRVLSAEGREAAATRWYDGTGGPGSESAVKAKAHCSTCGYFLPLAGVLRRTFGVCANEWSSSDGQVVALDHGCGAHSETDVEHIEPAPTPDPILDEVNIALEVEARVVADSEGEVTLEQEEVGGIDAAVPDSTMDLTDTTDASEASDPSEQD